MRFIDEVEISLRAGDGGNGCRSFLRQRSRPRGGPDGGDGGRGGNVLLAAVAGKHTLLDLRFQKQVRAENGKHGQGKNRHGRAGRDRVIQVPVGTLARDPVSGETLKDLRTAGDTFVAARGGRGGRGNAHFVSPTHRAPEECEPGEPGECREIRCELKLLADVGIVGLPNAGKSTLITAVSSARPKIADYPFTTLVPQLGLVSVDEGRSFVLADIPGILPGASRGVGLGLRFLRHVERSSVLLFLVDLAAPDTEDPLETYRKLEHELNAFSPELSAKQKVLAFNKVDLPLARQRKAELNVPPGLPVFFISALQKKGLAVLIRRLADQVERSRPAPDPREPPPAGRAANPGGGADRPDQREERGNGIP